MSKHRKEGPTTMGLKRPYMPGTDGRHADPTKVSDGRPAKTKRARVSVGSRTEGELFEQGEL